MKIEIDLNDLSHAYLLELSKEHKVSPDEIIEGLLVGHGLSGLIDKKCSQKPEKRKEKGCACYGNNSIHKCFC